MSAWRRKALEFLPQFRNAIESSDSPGMLWVEISNEFRDHAIEREDQEFIEGTLKYLSWSTSSAAGESSQQSALCGFLEDITYNKKHWILFKDWFDKPQFERYKGSFQYALSENEFAQLEDLFYDR